MRDLEAEGITPSALKNKPTLSRWVTTAWGCFNDLSSDRPTGMGLGPIPWSAIDRWADRHRIQDEDDFEDLTTLVRALDHAWLEFHSKK